MKRLLAIGAGLLLAASMGLAQTVTPPTKDAIKRFPLQKTEYPDGHVIQMVVVEFEPGAVVARHTHPGVETSYVLEGELQLAIEGKGPMTLKAGESFAVPVGTPHEAKAGAKTTRVLVTYVVDKTKPTATPAPK